MAVDTTQQGGISLGTKFSLNSTISGIGGSSPSIVTSGGKADASSVANVSGSTSPSPVTLLIGLLIIVVLLKIIGESPDTQIKGAHIHVGAYNIGTILAVSIGGIAFLKMILNAYQLPGATDLINFI